MSTRSFSMRLAATYKEESNEINRLTVEHDIDGQWQPLDLDVRSPGFDIFTYAILTCQHTYFRVNCAERGLLLDSATGELHIEADDDRRIESLTVGFSGKLRQGEPDNRDIDFIEARMQRCPVSINLAPARINRTSIQLEARPVAG